MRALLAVLVLACVTVSAGAAGSLRTPRASAQAWAVRVVVAGATRASSTIVASPPTSNTATAPGFAWPADGSVVSVGATTATSGTVISQNATGSAASNVSRVSIFGGEITADRVSASASAHTANARARGGFKTTAVLNLRVLGHAVHGAGSALGNWGYLTLDRRTTDTTAPTGAAGFRASVTELVIHLAAAHGGLRAGSEIQIGYAEAAAQTAPSAAKPARPRLARPRPVLDDPVAGDRPQLLPQQTGPLIGVPQSIIPEITGGPYDFPVYGAATFLDTYGVYRSDVSFHHGDDIFGQLGQSLIAVATGTVFDVGWNKFGGNRLWLRDSKGNEFYYAHLAAFSTLAVNGARVKAGEVVGFMGDTGDTEGEPTHLHFEVHPVSMLYLGYDGAVDPTTYLKGWTRPTSVPFPVVAGWAPTIPGTVAAPEPGALLLGHSDISVADGLNPGSLRRASR